MHTNLTKNLIIIITLFIDYFQLITLNKCIVFYLKIEIIGIHLFLNKLYILKEKHKVFNILYVEQ